MTVDWTKLDRANERIEAVLVDRGNCQVTVGGLDGLDPSTVKITEGYYTDTRAQCTFETYTADGNDGYDASNETRVRIVHSFDGYSKPLFTGYVVSRKPTFDNGMVKRSYELHSTLYTISKDTLGSNAMLGNQASISEANKKILETVGKESDLSLMADRRIQSPKVYEEASDTFLSILFDLNDGINRVDVDGLGRITIKKYTAPADLTPSLVISADDGMTIGDITQDDSSSDVPSRVFVKSSSDDSLMAVVDVPSDYPSSPARRGYTIAETVTVDYENPTYDQLYKYGKQWLEEQQDPGLSWKLTRHYQDLHEGDVVWLDVDKRHKCLVQTVKTQNREQKLTLKGLS